MLKRLNLNYIDGSIISLEKGCTTFDVSGDFLSTIYQNKIFVYEFDGENLNEITTSANADKDNVLASNSNGVFYIKGGEIVFSPYDFSSITTIASVTPDHLIANDEYVYYVINNNDIYSLKIGETKAHKLNKPESNFDLGKIVNINGFAFKGENLLITDSSQETIQEFRIEGKDLVFTGFAIASEKTAYNRVSKNTQKVEYNGNSVAVLDKNKITVVSDTTSDYSTENFINFVLNSTNINDICLGDNTFLGFFRNEDTSLNPNTKLLYAFDLKTKTNLGVILNTDYDIYDISYKSGKYYILSHDRNTTRSFIDVVSENNLQNATRLLELGNLFEKINVDSLGNYYFSNNTSLYVYNEKGLNKIRDLGGLVPTKIETDLSGKIYIATENNKLYKFNNGEFNEIRLNIDVKDFALSLSKREIYFVDGKNEKIYRTDKIDNSSIETLVLSEDYAVNCSTTSLEKLVSVSVRDGANVYGYSLNEDKIIYNGLKEVESEYLVISEISEKNSGETFLMLVGKNQTVFVNEKDATVIETPKFNAPSKVYVTTPVHAYYLPKITKTDDYVATIDGEKIFIELGSEIYPLKEVSFNDTAFYFAKVFVGDNEHLLYVPKSFTSEKIESTIETKTFSLRKLRPTTIYLDDTLTTALIETTENITIRLYSSKDGISEIEYYNGETWVKGYVRDKDVLNEPNTAIRNVLIVLAVITCACGSITFFIIRNKRKD